MYDRDNNLLGYVQLSDSPAYGTEIVDSVARALVGASAVAVVVAGGVGWFISKRISAPLLALTEVTGKMAERVEKTVWTLRRFVADAAHELHTPLTALNTNLELAVTETNGAQRELFLQRAQAHLKRLETMTNNLLDLSRIETGTAEGERKPVELNALIRETSELYASRAEQAGVNFDVDLFVMPLYVEGNEGQLQRAVGGLLDNAIKFTNLGGDVGIRLRDCDTGAEITVEDTGIGILDEDLPQLFSRFHRGRNAASYPGNGLGLAIIKAIVEAHGGAVNVRSKAGRGTTVTLVLNRQSVAR